MRRMYSKQDLEKIIQEKFHNATLDGSIEIDGDLDVSGDVKVKTLEQQEANWNYDLSDVQLSVGTGFSAQNIFSRVQVINKELEIIFTFSVTNEGETTATPSNVQIGNVTIPEEIGEKLIDVAGHDLTEAGTMMAIAGSRMVNNPSASPSVFNGQFGVLNISHNGENKLFIAAYGLQGIGAGATHTYSGRIQLTLL